MGSSLRLSDDELFDLCARNPELRFERTERGDLIVMTPAGGASSHRNAEVVAALTGWSRRDGTMVVFDASGGFLLPNGALRAPDVACVLRARLATLAEETKERFLPLCPDFVVELRSASDRLPELQAKMTEYRDNGARLGWLLDPIERRVHVYRPRRPVEVLEDPQRIGGDPELPDFVLELGSVWAPL
jgi:Uma2 family endonuclease